MALKALGITTLKFPQFSDRWRKLHQCTCKTKDKMHMIGTCHQNKKKKITKANSLQVFCVNTKVMKSTRWWQQASAGQLEILQVIMWLETPPECWFGNRKVWNECCWRKKWEKKSGTNLVVVIKYTKHCYPGPTIVSSQNFKWSQLNLLMYYF